MNENDLNTGAAFQQPSLENAAGAASADPPESHLDMTAKPPAVVVNSDKTDELSVALAESRKPVPANLSEPEKLPGKYALDYSLKGQAIHETHATVRSALARIAALGRLGIVPATSTNV